VDLVDESALGILEFSLEYNILLKLNTRSERMLNAMAVGIKLIVFGLLLSVLSISCLKKNKIKKIETADQAVTKTTATMPVQECKFNNETCLNLGFNSLKNDNKEEAKNWFSKACDADDFKGCTQRGIIDYYAGEKNKGMAWFIKGCGGLDDISCTRLGFIYVEKGQDIEAKAPLMRACNANNVNACDLLGSIEHKTGNRNEAEKYYKKACEGSNKNACYNLACILATGGKSSDALQMLERAVSLGFNDFTSMQQDNDLKTLHETEEFKKIINQNKQ
jgi:tetratricopeptide (TPR) repeat protein